MKTPLRRCAILGLFALSIMPLLACASFAQTAGRNVVAIRGHAVDVYYCPATSTRLNHKVLFAPGDGGWRGWAVVVAQQMASWGYDVYGVDTKEYLSAFTGGTRLEESDVMSDFHEVIRWINKGTNERVTLVGWSAGAGLSVLASASKENRGSLNGLITFGLPDINILGWCWKDALTYVTGSRPNEPTFRASGYMARIAPLPYVMIESTHDEYVPVEEAKSLASLAKEPKRLAIIEASNHRFDGNAAEFYRTLRDGLRWMN